MIKRRKKLKEILLTPFSASHQGHQPDFVLLAAAGLLLFCGLLFLSSASSSLGFYKHGQDTYYFVKQQIFNGVIPGLVFFYLALSIDYKKYQKHYGWFLLISIILLILVFIPGLRAEYGRARSWILVGEVSIQTSEIVKLAFIIFLAGWLSKLGLRVKNWRQGALPFIIMLAIIGGLLIMQPDLGTLSIIIFTSLAMYFVAGASLKHFTLIVGLGALSLLAMIKASAYRFNRFTAFLNPEADPLKDTYQIYQALIAVGSGGWLGLGLGYSRQKFNYLPEPAGDSIFAIIAEEVGFVFSSLLVILFAVLIYRGFMIVKNAPDDFGKLVALGIVIWLALQVVINIYSMIALMPLTGVTLPFISLGGSNLVVILISLGVLANISKQTVNQR